MTSAWRTLLRAMAREEWRLHTRLFGGWRFAAFPFLVAGIAVAGVAFAGAAGVDPAVALGGLHLLVLLFGLQTGALGLVGTDTLESVLGDLTFLLSAARTLPISRRRLFSAFLLKDAVYYSALFLWPLAAAVVGYTSLLTGPRVGDFALFVSLPGVFLSGVGGTLTLIGLARRGRLGRGVASFVVLAVAGGILAGLPLGRLTLYGFFRAPSAASFGLGALGTGAVLLAGWAAFTPAARSPSRIARARFGWLAARLPDPGRALVSRNLLEIHRSGGGLLKPVVTAGLVAGVAVGLVELAARVTETAPSAPVTLGALLGLTAFTTHNWLTQFDSLAEYGIYPIAVEEVFAAKRTGFLVLTLPIGTGFYAVVVAVFGGTAPEIAAGYALFVGFAMYLFGLTLRIAGLRPNEFLFDTVLFSGFTAALAAALVPALVVGLVFRVTAPVAAALLLGAGVLAWIGHRLYRQASVRWAGAFVD